MYTHANTPPPAQVAEWTARQARAALHAIQAEIKAESARQVALLSACASNGQQAEHIRGLVAITMAHLSLDASPATLENTTQWQAWALGLADSIEVPRK